MSRRGFSKPAVPATPRPRALGVDRGRSSDQTRARSRSFLQVPHLPARARSAASPRSKASARPGPPDRGAPHSPRVSVAAAENGGNARRTHSRALLPRRGSATPAELAAPLPRAAAGLGSFAGRGRRAHVPVGSGRYRAREPAKEPRPAGTGSRTAWALLLIGLMSQRPACSGRHGLECRPGRARVAAGTGWCAGQHWLV